MSEQVSVTQTRTVPVGDVRPHPDNARKGNLDRIERSLRDHGQFRPIVVHADTGHILAGNHTYRAAVNRLGWTHIMATFVHCTEAKARALLAVDNSSSDGSGYDDEALLTLLQKLDEDSLLLEGGFDGDDLDDLVAQLEELAHEPDSSAGEVPPDRGLSDRARTYDDSGSRMVVLNYPTAQFPYVIETLETLAGKLELESNAEVILHLIQEAAGTTAPEA